MSSRSAVALNLESKWVVWLDLAASAKASTAESEEFIRLGDIDSIPKLGAYVNHMDFIVRGGLNQMRLVWWRPVY